MRFPRLGDFTGVGKHTQRLGIQASSKERMGEDFILDAGSSLEYKD